MPFPPKDDEKEKDDETPSKDGEGSESKGGDGKKPPFEKKEGEGEKKPEGGPPIKSPDLTPEQAKQPEAMQGDSVEQQARDLANITAQATVTLSQLVDQQPNLLPPEEIVALQNAMVFFSTLAQKLAGAQQHPAEGMVPDGQQDAPDPASKPESQPKV